MVGDNSRQFHLALCYLPIKLVQMSGFMKSLVSVAFILMQSTWQQLILQLVLLLTQIQQRCSKVRMCRILWEVLFRREIRQSLLPVSQG